MSYPYDETYLEQIQKNKKECEDIRKAYYVLLDKYCHDNLCHDIELTLPQMFSILAEAFEIRSSTLSGVNDLYHLMGDVIDELLGEEY